MCHIPSLLEYPPTTPPHTHTRRAVLMSRRIKAFLSHDWGKDAKNHADVARIANLLRASHVDVWLDVTHLKGCILTAMARGIDNADVVVVFVTRNYVEKVASGGPSDNVRREFTYAASHCPHKLLPIRFDAQLPRTWGGPVGLQLGSCMYTEALGTDDRRASLILNALRQHCTDLVAHEKQPTNAGWKAVLEKHAVNKKVLRGEQSPLDLKTEKRTAAHPVRSRLALVLGVLGEESSTQEHIGDVLGRLYLSMIGTPVGHVPLVDKLAAIELELGISCEGNAVVRSKFL